LEWPELQRFEQGILHHFFGEIQAAGSKDPGSKDPRERGDQSSRLMPEQMVDQ
jgi:hypothetical protein